MPSRHLVPLWGLEEPLSALSHLLAVPLILVGGLVLARRHRRQPEQLAAIAVYAVSLCNLLLMSGVYHYVGPHHPLRGLFWKLDHASIWAAIAGTHTAVAVLLAYHEGTRRFLVLLWSVAAMGLVLEVTFMDRLPAFVSPLLYIGIGWLGIPPVLHLIRTRGMQVGWRILVGGGFATLGGLVDAMERPDPVPGVLEYHEFMHLCIVVGGWYYWSTFYAFGVRQEEGEESVGPSSWNTASVSGSELSSYVLAAEAQTCDSKGASPTR